MDCNLEWQPSIRDRCYGYDPNGEGTASDLTALAGATAALAATPLADGPNNYSVRSTYDVRPVNAYDFNFSVLLFSVSNNVQWCVGWQVPLGYRAVIRRFEIQYDGDLGGAYGNSWIQPCISIYPTNESIDTSPISSNSGNPTPVPYNSEIAIGSGGEIETFFIAEEGSWFGLTGVNANLNLSGSPTASVNCYGNLIPTGEMQLPFTIGNLDS
jgi:hypothetical protein